MNIGVFSDIHGRILLCFKLVERYQRETGQYIDLIIQCGDIGIFPDSSRLDKATKGYAGMDDTEMGFHESFVKPKSEVQDVLSKLDCDMICVRGNHEDHAHLDKLEKQTDKVLFPVDCYKRVSVLRSGVHWTFISGDSELNVFGMGRVGPPAGESKTTRDKYIQEYEKQRLSKLNKNVNIDVLLTHDCAKDFITLGLGMKEIRTCLDEHKPAYHFYGHTGRTLERRVDANGVSISVKLSDLEWKESPRGQILKPGCFGILRWQHDQNNSLEIVKEKWLNQYTPHTWKYL